MTQLLLAILSSTGIFVCFKYLEKYKIDILLAIVINYVVAALCGFILSDSNLQIANIIHQNWFSLSVIIGISFIFVFFVIGLSTQKAGLSVTTLASKMSFVLPMMFSIAYYHEHLSFNKLLGFLLAIASVLLSIYKGETNSKNRKFLWLPIVLFLGAGTVDSLIKFAQEEYLTSGGKEIFSTLLFLIAALSGILVLIVKKQSFTKLFQFKVLIWGSLLGLVNFGSLHFLIASLNNSGFDSSIVFSIINIGIVSASIILGIGVFKERLSKINILGIILAFIAIFILTKS